MDAADLGSYKVGLDCRIPEPCTNFALKNHNMICDSWKQINESNRTICSLSQRWSSLRDEREGKSEGEGEAGLEAKL